MSGFMEIVLILLQLMGELVLQVFGEALVRLICHGLSKFLGVASRPAMLPDRHNRGDRPTPPHPVIAACGYGLVGGVVGGLTLLVLPTALVRNPALRVFNLFFSPVLVGLLVVMLGQRQHHAKPRQVTLRAHQPSLRSHPQNPRQNPDQIYPFACGFGFAFAIALVRYLWAH
jgi:hypothetical protein